MRRPSPGTLIALLALFVALGGPAEAAKLITGKQVKKSTLTGKHIKNRSLGVGELTGGAVASLRAIAPGSVGAAALADGSVSAPKLAAGSVGSAQVADQSLVGVDLATNSVSADEVAPNSIQGDEVEDGRLGARDVGGFVGTVSLDFPSISPNTCQHIDVDVAAVAATTPPRSVGDDAVIVTPPSQFPDDQLVLSAAPVAPTKVRVRVCNVLGAGAVDLPALTYRYISFDF